MRPRHLALSDTSQWHVHFHCAASNAWRIPVESMTCRSTSACRTCEHSRASGACELEIQVDIALDSLVARQRVLISPAMSAGIIRASS
jgi:hypothetical protein